MADLFEVQSERSRPGDPLAERVRPAILEHIVGQDHLLGQGCLLRRLIDADQLPSLILWGPPGTGKTTLARLMADTTRAHFEKLSAVLSGVADLRRVLKEARDRRGQHGEPTLLFVDEIHRWSKSQQDALLDAVERGLITLIGATTENPSFELNGALLSRTRVFVLEPLDPVALKAILRRALEDEERGLGKLAVEVEPEALDALAIGAHGDARRALTALDLAVKEALVGSPNHARVTRAGAESALAHRALLYDKAGDAHYGVVSAFIKSMRGSDPDAATYYLARMLESGEDPRFVLRRLIIFASEDIGNADPMALMVATGALSAYELVGMPEGVLPLTQATTYLATAPKSNTVLKTYFAAKRDVDQYGPLPVPKKLLNATTVLQRRMGHGRGYRYPHDLGGLAVGETYLPERLAGRRYYLPSENGHEATLRERLEEWRAADLAERAERAPAESPDEEQPPSEPKA